MVPEGAWCLATRPFKLPWFMPLGVPSVFQLGLLASQIPLLEQSLFAPLKTTSSGFLKLMGESFNFYMIMYPIQFRRAS